MNYQLGIYTLLATAMNVLLRRWGSILLETLFTPMSTKKAALTVSKYHPLLPIIYV